MMYSLSLVTLNDEDNLLRLWVSIYVLHDVRCLRHNKFVYCSFFSFCLPLSHAAPQGENYTEMPGTLRDFRKNIAECVWIGFIYWRQNLWVCDFQQCVQGEANVDKIIFIYFFIRKLFLQSDTFLTQPVIWVL